MAGSASRPPTTKTYLTYSSVGSSVLIIGSTGKITGCTVLAFRSCDYRPVSDGHDGGYVDGDDDAANDDDDDDDDDDLDHVVTTAFAALRIYLIIHISITVMVISISVPLQMIPLLPLSSLHSLRLCCLAEPMATSERAVSMRPRQGAFRLCALGLGGSEIWD